ncbi:MAG: preprotein translocase subunit YajC [Flavobacteriales bacterium]|jgi:preprotein translocase subunit YajC|nr:preprotein translocase subunit YajC [Flavobacteriales bacterium]|tara:strand:+ start:76 stop:363 length:288 start_codon:yes stop_codon:yes gene_type:complete
MLTVLLQLPGSGFNMDFLILISVSMIIMYFFMIRPQVKKQKDESKFRSEIAKGDKVLTLGGIHAKVLEVQDETLLVQAEGGSSKFKINKTSIAKL